MPSEPKPAAAAASDRTAGHTRLPEQHENETGTSATRRSSWGSDLWRLGFVLVVFFFSFLGSRPLANPDEGRYAEIPREMALSNDYVTPRLDGVKYFEKPPFVYWLSALSFEAAGVNEWSARFGCAAFAVLGALLTYAAGRSLYGRDVGLFSAGVLSLSLLYYALSRILLLDLIVAVFISAALFAFLLGMREPAGHRRRNLFLAFYASMALATLTKGLIGFVLPCAVAGTWVVVYGQWRRLRPFHPFGGVLLFLVIAAPWHVLAARANPDFLYFYFVHEHFLRFTTTIHERYQPWWYFVPVLIAGLFPGVVFAAQALKHNFAGGWKTRKHAAEAWFLLVWIAVIFAFFSKSQSKLAPYITPVFPAAAVLIGRYLADRWRTGATRGFRNGLWVFAVAALVLAVACAVAPVPTKYPELATALRPWRVVLAGILGAGAIIVAGCTWRGRLRPAVVAAALSFALFLLPANRVAGIVDSRSTKSLAAALQPRLKPDDAVFCVGEYYQDFPVYLGRFVDVVDYEGELAFGIHAEPARTADRFIDGAQFLRRWREPRVAYALVARDAMATWFGDPAVPRSVIAANSRYVLLLNRNP